MKSLIIAFSTYSKIPMPQVKWDEKSMRYSMCFFPCIGIVIGVLWYLCLILLQKVDVTPILQACLLCVLPVMITGGIHVDGFMDTMDAKNSYRSKEEKLNILKDPHIGAFAVISVIVYFLLMFGMVHELVSCMSSRDSILVGSVFVLERILSGLAVVFFPKAKKDGMLASTAEASHKSVKIILLAELVLVCIGMIFCQPIAGGILIGVAGLVFLYYRIMSVKIFGGTTGDLAGYYLQITELILMITLVVILKWLA